MIRDVTDLLRYRVYVMNRDNVVYNLVNAYKLWAGRSIDSIRDVTDLLRYCDIADIASLCRRVSRR